MVTHSNDTKVNPVSTSQSGGLSLPARKGTLDLSKLEAPSPQSIAQLNQFDADLRGQLADVAGDKDLLREYVSGSLPSGGKPA